MPKNTNTYTHIHTCDRNREKKRTLQKKWSLISLTITLCHACFGYKPAHFSHQTKPSAPAVRRVAQHSREKRTNISHMYVKCSA